MEERFGDAIGTAAAHARLNEGTAVQAGVPGQEHLQWNVWATGEEGGVTLCLALDTGPDCAQGLVVQAVKSFCRRDTVR